MSMFVIRHMTCTMFKYLNPWIDFPKCIPTAKGWKKKKISLGALLSTGTSSPCPRAGACLSKPQDTDVKERRSAIHLVHHVSAVSRDTGWVCCAATKDFHACWGSSDRSPHLWMMARTIVSLLTRGMMVHFYSWHECNKKQFMAAEPNW